MISEVDLEDEEEEEGPSRLSRLRPSARRTAQKFRRTRRLRELRTRLLDEGEDTDELDPGAYDTDVPLALNGDQAVTAIQNWATQQLGNLDDLYAESYRDGYRNFNEQFPQYQIDDPTDDIVGGLADRAMSAHQASIGKMVNELTNLVFAAQGAQAISGWFNKNEKRVDSQAETLAWAAEQHGYREAGATSGANLQIIWELDEGADHCSDCPELADGSPYTDDDGENPLPSFPGAGDTECQGNCRCSLNYIESSEEPGGAEEAAAQAGQDIASIAQHFETEEAAKDEAAALIGIGMDDLGAHGLMSTLDTLGEAISDLDREVGFALTSSGRVITAHVGTKDSVIFQPAQIKAQRRAALSVHNHPGGQSFSPSDVAFAHAMQFGEMRVYSRDYIYTLKPADGKKFNIGQGKAITTYAEHAAQEMLDVYISDAEKAYADQFKGVFKYGKMLDWPDFWKLESKDFWHNVWDDVAPKFGLEYGRVSQNLEHVLLPKPPVSHGPSIIDLKPGTDVIHEETPHAAHGIGWLPPNFPQDWDQLKSAKFEHIAGPKGSQEGYWLRDKETGQEYYVKPQVSAERAMNEVGTMRAYEAFGAKPGVDIPFVGLIKDDAGKRYVVSQKMPGLISRNASWWSSAGGATAREYAEKHWATDALLSHWDVAGLNLDNLMVNAAGVPVRIEGGAGMKFRAQGQVKTQWSTTAPWNEPWTMRAIAHGGDPASQQVAPIFGQISNAKAAELLGKLADEFTPEVSTKLEDAWAKLGMPAAQRYENLDVLHTRLQMIPKVQEELGLSPTMTKAEPHLPPKPETPGLPQAPAPAAPATAAKPLHQAFPAEYAEFKKQVPDYAVKVATQDMQASTMTVRREAAFERMAHDYINKEPSLKKLKKAWTFFEQLAPEKLTSILNHVAEEMVKEEKAIYAAPEAHAPQPFSEEAQVVDFAKDQLTLGAMPEDLVDIIGQAIADNTIPYHTPDEVKAILKKNDLIPAKVRDIPDTLQNEVVEMYQEHMDNGWNHAEAIDAIAAKYHVPPDVAESSVAKFKKAWDAEVSVTGLPPGMFEQAKEMGFIDAYASHSPVFPSNLLDAAHAWQEGTPLSPKLTAWFEQHADALGLEKSVPLPTSPPPVPGPFSYIAPQAGLEPITNEQLDTLWGMYNDQLGIANVKLDYYDFANALGMWAAEGSDLKIAVHSWFDAFATQTLKADQYVPHIPIAPKPAPPPVSIKALPIVTAKSSGNLYSVWKEDGLNIGLILGHGSALSLMGAEDRSIILQKLIGGIKPEALKDHQIVRVRVGNNPASYLDTDKVSGKKVIVLNKDFWQLNPEGHRNQFSNVLGKDAWKADTTKVYDVAGGVTTPLSGGFTYKTEDIIMPGQYAYLSPLSTHQQDVLKAFKGGALSPSDVMAELPFHADAQKAIMLANLPVNGIYKAEDIEAIFKPEAVTGGINPLNPFPAGSIKSVSFNATTGSFDTFLDKGGFNPNLVSWELASNKAAWKEAYDLASTVMTDDEVGQAWYAALTDQWKAKGMFSAMQAEPSMATWAAYKVKIWEAVKVSAGIGTSTDPVKALEMLWKADHPIAGTDFPALYKSYTTGVDYPTLGHPVGKSVAAGWMEAHGVPYFADPAPAYSKGNALSYYKAQLQAGKAHMDAYTSTLKAAFDAGDPAYAQLATNESEKAFAAYGVGIVHVQPSGMPTHVETWIKTEFTNHADNQYVTKIWNHLYLDTPLDLDSIGGPSNLAYWEKKFEGAGMSGAASSATEAVDKVNLFGQHGGFGQSEDAKTVTWPALYKQAVASGATDDAIAHAYWEGLGDYLGTGIAPAAKPFEQWKAENWPATKAVAGAYKDPAEAFANGANPILAFKAAILGPDATKMVGLLNTSFAGAGYASADIMKWLIKAGEETSAPAKKVVVAAWNPLTDPTAAKFVKANQALFDAGEIAKAYSGYTVKPSKAYSYWSRPKYSLQQKFPQYNWDAILGTTGSAKPAMTVVYRRKVFAQLYSMFINEPDVLQAVYPTIGNWFKAQTAPAIDKAALQHEWNQVFSPEHFEDMYNSWTTGDIVQGLAGPIKVDSPVGQWFTAKGVPGHESLPSGAYVAKPYASAPAYVPPPVVPAAPHPLGLNPEAKPVLEAFQKGEKSALDAITELGAKDYDVGDVQDALKKYAPDKAAEVDAAMKDMMTPEAGAEAQAEIAGIQKEWNANVDPLAEEFAKQNAVLYGLWEKEKMQLSGGFFLKMVKTLTKDIEDQPLAVRKRVAFARLLTRYTTEPEKLKKELPKIYKWWGNTIASSEEAGAGNTIISDMPSALSAPKFETLPTGWDSQAELIKSSDYLQKSVAGSRQWYDMWKLEGGGKTTWEKFFEPTERAQMLAFYQQQGKTAEQATYAVRGLAFAKSYVMAKAGMFKELDAISPAMSKWWKDLLFPPPPTPLAKGKAPWAQWVDGRGYKSGNYSGLTRQIEDALKGHSEMQSRWYTLQRGVSGWKSGSQGAYHSAGEKMIKGLAPTNEYEKSAQAMWETIRDAAPEAPKLHRWIEHGGVKADLNWWRGNIGKTVDMQLSGFSDPKGDYGHGRNVLYVLKPGSQSFWGMPISPGYSNESEWWAGGRFKITNVEQGTGGRIDGVPGTVQRNTTVVYIDFVTPDRAGPSVLHES